MRIGLRRLGHARHRHDLPPRVVTLRMWWRVQMLSASVWRRTLAVAGTSIRAAATCTGASIGCGIAAAAAYPDGSRSAFGPAGGSSCHRCSTAPATGAGCAGGSRCDASRNSTGQSAAPAAASLNTVIRAFPFPAACSGFHLQCIAGFLCSASVWQYFLGVEVRLVAVQGNIHQCKVVARGPCRRFSRLPSFGS